MPKLKFYISAPLIFSFLTFMNTHALGQDPLRECFIEAVDEVSKRGSLNQATARIRNIVSDNINSHVDRMINDNVVGNYFDQHNFDTQFHSLIAWYQLAALELQALTNFHELLMRGPFVNAPFKAMDYMALDDDEEFMFQDLVNHYANDNPASPQDSRITLFFDENV